MTEEGNSVTRAIDKALERNGLQEAEQITGKSYTEDRGTSMLGLLQHIDISEQKKAILSVANDTYQGMPFDRFAITVQRYGFVKVLDIGFQGKPHGSDHRVSEHFCILWHPLNLLLVVDSCNDDISSAKVYYNWRPDKEKSASRFMESGTMTESGIAVGYHDAREGLLHNLDKLRRNGRFVSPWVEQPFLWFAHWEEMRGKQHPETGKIADRVLKERIKLLPEHVQDAIQCERR